MANQYPMFMTKGDTLTMRCDWMQPVTVTANETVTLQNEHEALVFCGLMPLTLEPGDVIPMAKYEGGPVIIAEHRVFQSKAEMIDWIENHSEGIPHIGLFSKCNTTQEPTASSSKPTIRSRFVSWCLTARRSLSWMRTSP